MSPEGAGRDSSGGSGDFLGFKRSSRKSRGNHNFKDCSRAARRMITSARVMERVVPTRSGPAMTARTTASTKMRITRRKKK